MRTESHACCRNDGYFTDLRVAVGVILEVTCFISVL